MKFASPLLSSNNHCRFDLDLARYWRDFKTLRGQNKQAVGRIELMQGLRKKKTVSNFYYYILIVEKISFHAPCLGLYLSFWCPVDFFILNEYNVYAFHLQQSPQSSLSSYLRVFKTRKGEKSSQYYTIT